MIVRYYSKCKESSVLLIGILISWAGADGGDTGGEMSETTPKFVIPCVNHVVVTAPEKFPAQFTFCVAF